MQTGVSPEEHGIIDFTRAEEGYNLRENSLMKSDSDTLWDSINSTDKTAIPLNVFMLFPASTSIAPKMVSGLPAPNLDELAVKPDSLLEKIKSEYPDYVRVPNPPDSYDDESISSWTERSKVSIEDKFDLAEDIIEEDNPELLWLHIHDTDSLQHYFWPYLDPMRDDLKSVYEKIDQKIGEIVDEDKNVIILSDHGFRENKYEIKLNNWLQEKGYIYEDTSVRRKNLIKDLTKKILPQKVVQFYRKSKRDQNKQTLGDKIMEETITHEETKAYAYGIGRGKIYLKDESVKDDLISDLKDMEFKGRKVVKNVTYYPDIEKDSPNLIVEPKEPFSFKHDFADHMISENEVGEVEHLGTHDMRGIFLARGPMFQCGEISSGIKIESIRSVVESVMDIDTDLNQKLREKLILKED
jgi:predicted AlkP superfamily phosphohydrolase/phosphomutase